MNILIVVAGIYIAICILLYFFQEKLIFFPQKLPKEYVFSFGDEFEELHIRTDDGTVLNGLLFKSEHPKGLVFYLHGNAGSLDSWGEVAKTYTQLNYDVFILDYRGYGKSGGSIDGQEQLFEDNQVVYNALKDRYDESDVIILGYSIGTGMAAKLASQNSPKLLILQSPYYSLVDLMRHTYVIVPTFLLKYKFETYKYLKNCSMPVVIFHGDKDEVIYHGSSVKLKNEFGKQVSLVTLVGQGHNGMGANPDYIRGVTKVLE